MIHPEVEYLVLQFNPDKHSFSCQQIFNPEIAKISEYTSFPMIYKEGNRVYHQEIPQAELELKITTGFGSVNVGFNKFGGEHFDKKTINKVSFYAQGEVASYIADTLNNRMAELLNDTNEVSNLGIICKYRKLNQELKNENKYLKEQLVNLENIREENQNLHTSLITIKNKWYLKIARLFEKNI